MEYHLVTFTTDTWQKFDQNSINSYEGETCVHAYYALLYALYTDYIKIPSVCVLSSKELIFADTLISLLAHGRYA
jgi:hypothetical protein